MKVFICLFALIAAASASAIHHAPVHADVVAAPAVVSTGTSSSSRTQDAAGHYAFAYNEQHATGGSSRSESGAPGVATGSYTLNVADGRSRQVNYVADALGFRAAIATNEPGTAALPAASTAISSPFAAPLPVAPLAPVAHVAHADVVAPLAHGHYAAPVAHHAPLAVAHHAPLDVAHHAPLAVAHHAPLAVAHAPVAHAVPLTSSYSSVVNHGVVAAAPVAVAHHAAPLLAAPLAHGHLGHLGAHY